MQRKPGVDLTFDAASAHLALDLPLTQDSSHLDADGAISNHDDVTCRKKVISSISYPILRVSVLLIQTKASTHLVAPSGKDSHK